MAAKFWVGGGTNTNWNSSPTTNWANSSGGTGNQTAPATGDDVTFDNASGTTAAVWNTAISLNSLVCNASRNTVSGAAAITISGGNFSLPGGVGSTYTGTNAFTFTGTSGTQTITNNGKTLGGALTLNGSGGTFQLQDALNSTTTITLTAGTFDCQTFTVSCLSCSITGSTARTLKGSGAWTLTSIAGATIWDATTITNLTLTNFTSDINLGSGVSTNQRTFIGGGATYANKLVLPANSSQGPITIQGNNTFSGLTLNGPCSLVINNASTQTFSNPPTVVGSSASAPIYISNSAAGTTSTISVASGTVNLSWSGIRSIAFSGGATFNAYNSLDLGKNSGITINASNATRSQHAQAQL